jgi:HEPN domain-containing protein
MKDNDILYEVITWLNHAKADIALARNGLSLSLIETYQLVAFHAQQCAEKSLKAYLIFWEIDFPYTHNISLLLELCAQKSNWIAKLENAKKLTAYATTLRYPRINTVVTKEEAIYAINIAEQTLETVKKALMLEGFDLE